jgi:putative phosphoesterase
MKIGLISDTHIPGGATEIPEILKDVFRDVDLILHAGNVYMLSVLDWLESIAPIKVAGALDRDKMCHGDPRVEDKQVIELEGTVIGVIHDLMVPGFGGWIYPGSLSNVYDHKKAAPLVPDEMFGRKVDVIVFGHTCTVLVEEYGDTLLINPGSPTLRDQLRKIGTVVTLEISPGKRDAQIIDLAKLL